MPVTLLEQREIEAKVAVPLAEAFAAEVGAARAREIVAGVVERLARAAGAAAADAVGGTSLPHLREAVGRFWEAGGALELTVLRCDDEALEFHVTRCRYAEMYERLGLKEWGPVLSCARDGAMIEGFNPELALDRPQTILGGAECCVFRYRKADRSGERPA